MVRAILFAGVAILGAGVASGQPIAQGVVKLTARTWDSKKLGTGICLDTPCEHVLTSYHVVALMGTRLKVEGVHITTAVAATGPQDSGAVDMVVAGSIVRFNPARDLALLTLKKPLPARFGALRFADYTPAAGQEVTRVARHDDTIDYAMGRVVGAELLYQSSGGLMNLDGNFLVDCVSRPGNSGGAVIDREGRVVGMVEMRSREENGRAGTAVLSNAIISEFLRGNEPLLWARLFEKSQVAASGSNASEFTWPVALDHAPIVSEGAEDREMLVDTLRTQVAKSVAQMHRMTAQQSMRFWGNDQREQSWDYQVSMYSDGQRFRTAAGKDVDSKALPGPSVGILPESEWYDILAGIGSLRLHYKGASSHEGSAVHVFVFQNSASDEVCQFRQRAATLFGYREATNYVDCDGVVVADEHFRVLGITHRMMPQTGVVSEWQAIARYGISDLSTRNEAHLVPLSMDLSARFRNGKVYYASERWSNYHLFLAESSLRTD